MTAYDDEHTGRSSGESFTLIPALNDQPQWVAALGELIGDA